MIGIYCFENKINGKRYIGKSKDIEARYKAHTKKAINDGTYFHNALKKYGVDAFNFTILEECEESKLNEREEYYISHFDTYNNGYNMTLGGDGGDTLTNHPDIINIGKKISKKLTKPKQPKLKVKHTSPMKGRHHTEESKQKINETKLKNDTVPKGEKNGMYGRKRTEAEIQNFSKPLYIDDVKFISRSKASQYLNVNNAGFNSWCNRHESGDIYHGHIITW